MYGHVAQLSSSIRAGVESTGCECRIFQVAETLPDDVLAKMHAPPKNKHVPVIRPEQLVEADGFLFGIPTRFGTVPAQIKTFFDACGGHWLSDALIGKPVSNLVSLLPPLFYWFSLRPGFSFQQRRLGAVKRQPLSPVCRFLLILVCLLFLLDTKTNLS
jgi:hypothetical protein